MILGPIQTQWLAGLRANPEQQMKGSLGIPHENKYCCLGKGLVIAKGGDIKIDAGRLKSGNCAVSLNEDYRLLGLYSHVGKPIGGLRHQIKINGKSYDSLACANDEGATWPEIADWIEANADKIFTKAV